MRDGRCCRVLLPLPQRKQKNLNAANNRVDQKYNESQQGFFLICWFNTTFRI